MLAFSNSKNVEVTNCIFMENTARVGGAIWIKFSDVKLLNNKFLDNRALAPENIEGSGGAIFFDCSATEAEVE